MTTNNPSFIIVNLERFIQGTDRFRNASLIKEYSGL